MIFIRYNTKRIIAPKIILKTIRCKIGCLEFMFFIVVNMANYKLLTFSINIKVSAMRAKLPFAIIRIIICFASLAAACVYVLLIHKKEARLLKVFNTFYYFRNVIGHNKENNQSNKWYCSRDNSNGFFHNSQIYVKQ